MNTQNKTLSIVGSAALIVMLTMTAGTAAAQAKVTDQDKTFVNDVAHDSNFEIRTSRLAISKSPSADVRAYATMVLHDHNQLQPLVGYADKAIQVKPLAPGSMGLGEDAKYAELKVLSGKSFDDAYIKGLINGNEDTLQKEKSEIDGTTLPAVKRLAQRAFDYDTKHAAKAKQLAAAHNVQP